MSCIPAHVSMPGMKGASLFFYHICLHCGLEYKRYGVSLLYYSVKLSKFSGFQVSLVYFLAIFLFLIRIIATGVYKMWIIATLYVFVLQALALWNIDFWRRKNNTGEQTKAYINWHRCVFCGFLIALLLGVLDFSCLLPSNTLFLFWILLN